MADKQTQNESTEAMKHEGRETEDAEGKLTGDRGDAKADASGYRGNNPGTAGSGATNVTSATPENSTGRLDPSSPGATGTTPGSNTK